jgi:superfamily I DNA/RNA helicase
MQPTEQQAEAARKFLTRQNLKIQAGAGTGKTSTLALCGQAAQILRRRGIYVAFNAEIAREAQGRFTSNVACSTAHSLAYRAVGYHYQTRLNDRRRHSWRDWAEILGLRIPIVGPPVPPVKISPRTAVGMVRRGLEKFIKSSDPQPGHGHLCRKHGNNTECDAATELEPYLLKACADIWEPNGRLPFTHDHYLKIWQLSRPVIPADFILVDEAQDLDPVLLAILGAQQTQLVYVGDAAQAIYGWRGAINAMTQIQTGRESQLTQSFRFGDAIAEEANRWLEQLPGAPLRLQGLDAIDSQLIELPDARAVLTRTNAGAIRELLEAQDAGKKTHLAGKRKVSELTFFVKGVMRMINGQDSDHQLLADFKSWREVQNHAEEHPDDAEIVTLVRLVKRFGPRAMLNALENVIDEDFADRVISTTHSAKGREWDTVRIAPDFTQPEAHNEDGEDQGLSTEEVMLRYVAVTRARKGLDCAALHAGQEQLTLAGEA